MIDELKILQSIVGDLSGLGAWLVAAYLSYKVIFLAAIIYLIKFIVNGILNYFRAGITRQEAEAIQAEMTSRAGRHEAAMSAKDCQIEKARSETEKVKHMYKILKEKNDASTGSNESSESTSDESTESS